MDKEQLNEIVQLASSVPEMFREKCFELLLSNSLNSVDKIATTRMKDGNTGEEEVSHTGDIPFVVKSFLQEKDLSLTKVLKLFQFEGDQVIPLYNIDITKTRAAQINHMLLLSFENSFMDGKFIVHIEGLRDRCIKEKCYDKKNFSSYTKNSFFKNISDKELILTNDGKDALAKLLLELTKNL